jgi:triosephosphate isomerase
MRRPLIAANWKMYLGRREEARGLVRRLRPRLTAVDSVDVALCVPFTVLADLADVLRHSTIALGAQTMHEAAAGAHTGDIAPTMLRDLCAYVILGHSERRAAHGADASDAAVNRKVLAALEHGLVPIICCGESLTQREAGETDDFVGEQVRSAIEGVGSDAAARCVFAYEPIWAIGSGLAATPAEANRTIGLTVRGAMADRWGESAAERSRILYGGSVNASNIADFIRMPEVDGALVGGASLDEGFAELVRSAAG